TRRVDRRVMRDVRAVPTDVIQRIYRARGVRREGRRHASRQSTTVIDRDGRVQPYQAVAVWNAELPPDPDKRETMLHEEAVAEISFRRGVGNLRPTVDVLNDVLPAAIEHIKQGGAVATRRLL